MSTKDFQQIQNNVGGLLSITSFLSTSKSKNVAEIYVEVPSEGRRYYLKLQLIPHRIQVLPMRI